MMNFLGSLELATHAIFSANRGNLSAALSDAEKLIFDAHKRGASGGSVCRARAIALDCSLEILLAKFYASAKSKAFSSEDFCVVALGGYGRGELAPKSDADILFLFRDGIDEAKKTLLVKAILYPLWDFGLKLGDSEMTQSEAIQSSFVDPINFFATLDARFLLGSKSLFDKFSAEFAKLVKRLGRERIDELYRLKLARHTKFAWTAYLLEPNLKNGVGGLRDIQTISWIGRLWRGLGNLGALARAGYISKSEYAAILRAEDFIKRVRNQIHFASSRATDILNMSEQSAVAEALLFSGEDEEARADAMMRRLYSAFKTVDTLARAIRRRARLELPADVLASMPRAFEPSFTKKKIYVDGFVVYNGLIDAQRTGIFKSDPLRLLKLFLIAQKYGAVLSDRLESLTRASLHLIDADIRASQSANALFLEILSQRGKVAPAMRMMAELGVLGAFIPEFADIECFVQRELFHRYTVDAHTLDALAVADKVFAAREGDVFWRYHAELVGVSHPAELLYLALFLHDLGKGDALQGHAQVGAEIAETLCHRFSIGKTDTALIVFAVRHHLEMARFWSSRDIEDSGEIEKFAAIFPSEAHLKFLYVLTFCDASATSDTFWNSYKQSLHDSLFASTLSRIRNGEQNISEIAFTRKWEFLAEILEDNSLRESAQFTRARVDSLPESYFLYHGISDLSMHIGMIGRLFRRRASAEAKDVPPVVKWIEDPSRSVVRLYVVSFDTRGLFSLMAGVISIYGMSILASKAFTCSDGVTTDAFYLTGVEGVSRNDVLRRRFSEELARFYRERGSLDSQVRTLSVSNYNIRKRDVKVSAKKVDGGAVVRFSAPDRDGLLYFVSSVISSCGYDINFARIDTPAGFANDVFKVSPTENALSLKELVRSIQDEIAKL